MAVTLQYERDNIYRVEISGRLRKHDLDAVQRPLATEIRRVGNVRLLVTLANFLGWEEDAGWQDLGFYVRYGDQIERIAIVGDKRWRGEALMFVAADLRKAPVAFFPTPDTHTARAWLAA